MKKKHKIVKVEDYLYVLSDDEIKEGDWFMGNSMGAKLEDVRLCNHIKGKFYYQDADEGYGITKKIIATTDPKLNLPQIPQSLIEYYAKHQPEEAELKYKNQSFICSKGEDCALLHGGDLCDGEIIEPKNKLKLQDNEVVWIESSKEQYDKAMKYAYGLCTHEKVEELFLQFRQDHLYTFDTTSEEDVKQWLKEKLKLK